MSNLKPIVISGDHEYQPRHRDVIGGSCQWCGRSGPEHVSARPAPPADAVEALATALQAAFSEWVEEDDLADIAWDRKAEQVISFLPPEDAALVERCDEWAPSRYNAYGWLRCRAVGPHDEHDFAHEVYKPASERAAGEAET